MIGAKTVRTLDWGLQCMDMDGDLSETVGSFLNFPQEIICGALHPVRSKENFDCIGVVFPVQGMKFVKELLCSPCRVIISKVCDFFSQIRRQLIKKLPFSICKDIFVANATGKAEPNTYFAVALDALAAIFQRMRIQGMPQLL